MSPETRWMFWSLALLAGLVALLLLVATLTHTGWPAEAQRYFDPAYLARAREYSRIRHLIYLLGQALPAGLLLLAIARGWHHQAADWVAGLVAPRSLLAVALLTGLTLLAMTLLGLPAGIVRFVVDHRYGLSTQTPGLWVADLLRSVAISLAVTMPLLAGLFWIIRRLPGLWWPAAAAGFALYLLAASALAPVLIDPLFHRFTPLQDPAMAGEIRELARRAGVPVDEVLVMDASRRTRRVNAYFTGVGGTRRIVLYDTLLQGYDRRHVMLVLAHELGHWRLGHIYQGIALGSLGGVFTFWLAQRLLNGAGGRPGEPAQVVVLLAFLWLVSFASLPLQNWISRTFERQADRFALELTGDGPGMAQLEVQLGRDNLADPAPHPLTVAVLYTHPPLLERIETALEYSP